MSSKQQSDQSSISSSSESTRPSPRSLIVFKVSLDKDETLLFNDLCYNYPNVIKVCRNYDENGNKLSSIRVDFNSSDIVLDILDENLIYIQNKSYSIRPYWPRICYRCQEEGHISIECPRTSFPEWRLSQLLEEQKSNFASLINDFEKRWSTRLLTLKTSSPKTANVTELFPVVNELTTVCTQMNQMQKQLNEITNRIENIQKTVKN